MLNEETIVMFEFLVDRQDEVEELVDVVMQAENLSYEQKVDWLIDELNAFAADEFLDGVNSVGGYVERLVDAAFGRVDWQWIAEEFISAKAEGRHPQLPWWPSINKARREE
ncbi:MAG: hypothetical protein JRD89_00355 [Deltaproteobacteria bacterium]|nr:hypothetical protein [Deltaproteobacteria bacterium]